MGLIVKRKTAKQINRQKKILTNFNHKCYKKKKEEISRQHLLIATEQN